ncbi:MAG TPA: sigma-70 family RNA polymerase sigma factor [Polyangiaceae bacterium]
MSPADDINKGEVVPDFSEAAFEAFHAETFSAVWTMARRLCRDESEAQDIAQIAYLGVYRYWRDGKLLAPPRRLLFRAAQRAAIDVLRARSRRLRLFDALPKDTGAGWVESDLRDALRILKPDDAALVMLQAAGGLNYEELAAIRKQSVPAIRSRLFRARAQLRRALYGVQK